MRARLLSPLFVLLTLSAAVAAEPGTALDQIIPRLSSARAEDRYAAQQELLALSAGTTKPGSTAAAPALAKAIAARLKDGAVLQPTKVLLVRQLEYIGGEESVATLAALLRGSDTELRDCARRALEKNPARAAGDALRQALEDATAPDLAIGLMQSVGERRDNRSVSLLVRHCGERRLAPAAFSALGKIASDEAVAALTKQMESTPEPAAQALLAAATVRLAEGNAAAAAKSYQAVYDRCPTFPLQAAALSGLAKADPIVAVKAAAAALSSPDVRLQAAAVAAARQALGPKSSTELVAWLPRLSPAAKTCVIRALDASAERTLTRLVGDPDTGVAVSALEQLGQVGTVNALPALFICAASPAPVLQKPAAVALARISGPGIDAAITTQAAAGDGKLRIAAITALGDRNQAGASAALLQFATDPEPAISQAACAALGRSGSDKDLEPLVHLVMSGKCPGAESALQAVANRSDDKSAAAKVLVAATRDADAKKLASVFDVLAMLGGSDALAAVTRFVPAENAEVKDAAIRALAAWPEFAACKALLSIAAAPETTLVHHVLAIQGLTRLVKSSEREPAQARIEVALAAVDTARREQEKKQVLSAFAAIPNSRSADVLISFLSNPALRLDAAQAGINLAQSLPKSERATARKLAQAVKDANVSPELSRKAEAILQK